MKTNEIIANTGEVIVAISALAWLTHSVAVPYAFAIGTALFVYGRMALGTPKGASLWLIAAAALMFFQTTRYIGYGIYITPSSWLAPFIGFVVNEVYFAFKK